MARGDDCDRIPAVGRTDGARRTRAPDLSCELCVGSRLTEWNRQQCAPDFLLKRRAGEVELQVERPSSPVEVLCQLPLGLGEHWMPGVLGVDLQPHAARTIGRPQDAGKTFVGRDQLEPADRRVYPLVNEAAPRQCRGRLAFLTSLVHCLLHVPKDTCPASTTLAIFGRRVRRIHASENG
jgi:hypothetical protein